MKKEYYYVDQGKRLGPIDEERFHQLIATGVITLRSLVWCVGMTEWMSLAQSGITFAPPDPTVPPPFPGEAETMDDRYPRPQGGMGGATPYGTHKTVTVGERPEFNNNFLWVMAFTPLISYISLSLFAGMNLLSVLIVNQVMVLGLFVADLYQISKNEYTFRYRYLWFLVHPIIYIILRCKDTRIGYGPAFLSAGVTLSLILWDIILQILVAIGA